MTKIEFPDASEADEQGLLAIGGELSPDYLIAAYSKGIFPWPFEEEGPIPWFSPDPRCLLKFSDFRIPRSFKKFLKRHTFRVSIDQATEQVIDSCASVERGSGDDLAGLPSTWINSEMRSAYKAMAKLGFCHSVECWEGENLVGGLYGISIGSMFAGESMFHLKNGASKVCLVNLVEHLEPRGAEWIDCQQLTPLLESFGAKEVARSEFLVMLEDSLKNSPGF